ncbi:sigma-70 family RNA polymerase sigma factor [Segetibacter sp.]|jgi:RNA polymerase sigma factor (sigma-70 family)|uniref:RNA polymerase sigma factor n=1 Tax=Segetibacter sp. TaxID=2231182 RepID=UPI00260DA009|nr:sigma-70 family RNA polymerase sigma factor [Segetibacter sp.]MCW3080212.1 sigma-70 family polymerase sigma factor [Segetibacter sp.]
MNTHSTQTEASLIASCIRGERKSQKALYELYSAKLYSICFKYTKNSMDAEDVLQDGFVKLFCNLHKFKGEGSFEGWMRRIFVNTAIEHLRRKKYDTKDWESFGNTILDKEPTALDLLYKKDLIKSSQSLSRGYRTVFDLYAVQGFSHQQIARRLGISESTSKSQFSRAKALLRTVVQERRSA